MIATSLRSGARPALLRSLHRAHAPSSFRALASRPLGPRVVAYKEGEEQGGAAREGGASQPVARREPGALGSQLSRRDPYAGLARLPSIFQEMQREMDALTRTFGLWDDDFFTAPLRSPLTGMASSFSPPASSPSSSMLPTIHMATDVAEDDKAWTIKADIPGM